MPAQTDHPCFQQPPNLNMPIWRYMDFAKFVAFLERRSLFFCRADKFDDPYEGATSHANYGMRSEVYGEQIPAQTFENMARHNEWIRQWTFVNCWHMSEHESAAMWKLYARTEEAVAIKSTYFKLQQALPNSSFLGIVHYIDYERDWLPEGNSFWPFVHKRRSFEHERELRAVIQDLPLVENCVLIGNPNPESGVSVEVAPEAFVDEILVSPTAPQWFADLVSAISDRFEYRIQISQSKLSQNPVF